MSNQEEKNTDEISDEQLEEASGGILTLDPQILKNRLSKGKTEGIRSARFNDPASSRFSKTKPERI